VPKDSTPFHDYFALIFPIVLFHHFEGVRIKEAPRLSTRPAPLRDTRGRPVLIGLCAILLIAATSGCARNLGGTISGWSPATASAGLVYVGTKQGEVLALADNGFDDVSLEHTSAEIIPGIHHSVAIGESLIFASSSDGHLYALEKEGLQLGERGWRIPVGLSSELEPLIAGPALWISPVGDLQIVLVGSEDGSLYAYDAKPRGRADLSTDPLLWSFATGDKIWSTPVIRESTAYFGSHDHNVYALYLDEGRDNREKWRFATGGTVASRPLLFQDMVIVGSFDKKLYALDADDGTRRWTFEGDNWFWAGAVSDGRTIFAPSMDGNIYALDAGGNLRWKHQMGSAIVSTPVLTTAGLVVAGKNGKLSLLDTDLAPLGQSQQISVFTLRDTEVKAPLSMWVTPRPTTEEQWRLLLQMISGGQLAQDPRFATATGRQDYRQELQVEIDRWMATQNQDTIGRRLFEAGIPLEESVFVGAQDSTVWRFDIKGAQLRRVWCFHSRDGRCE
jgi:outer membrane protein assembly factor BamB